MIAPIDGAAIPLRAPNEPFDGGARPLEAPEVGGSAFAEILGQAVASANAQGVQAAHAASDFAAGRRDDIHGTMIELTKADIELRVVGNIKNKLVDAFYEIWRMQV